MNKFEGIYRFFIRDFKTQQLIGAIAKCVVIRETDKSYRIKLLTPIQRRMAGEELWVRKTNIIRRSYLIFGTRFCEKYNIEVAEQSCRACLQDCLTKMDLQRDVNNIPDIRR